MVYSVVKIAPLSPLRVIAIISVSCFPYLHPQNEQWTWSKWSFFEGEPGQISCECLEGPQVSYYSELACGKPAGSTGTQKVNPKKSCQRSHFWGFLVLLVNEIHDSPALKQNVGFEIPSQKTFFHTLLLQEPGKSCCFMPGYVSYVLFHSNWAMKKNLFLSIIPLYWLFNRDPSFMVYEIIPI